MLKPKLKIYFDTSVPSNFYDTYPAEQVALTRLFWNEVLPHFKPHISPITIQEIKQTPGLSKRKQTLALVRPFTILTENQEIESLASKYIQQKIVPKKNILDAFHVAFASCHKIDYLVTWNIKHMASPKSRSLIFAFNASKGLFIPIIATPEELIKQFYEQE